MAFEAADSGLLSLELAAGIRRVNGVRRIGVRVGNWLTAEQAKQLLAAPDRASLRGKRDYAMIAMLIGCGLRRGELLALREISASVRDARCLRLMGRLAWHTVAEIGTMPNAIGKSSLDAKRHQND